MATAVTPNAQSGEKAQAPRVKTRGDIAARLRLGGQRRRSRITVIETGFFVLVVLTTWMIASVSMWWVPLYLLLVVTIFVVPRRRERSSGGLIGGSTDEFVDVAGSERALRADLGDAADQICHLSLSDADVPIGESAESSDGKSDLTTGRPFKSRRNRVRARKAAKPASEPDVGASPVLWVQTAPGKFVRADAGTQPADSAKDDSTAGSVTEEYGIAPSIFSLAPESNAAAEGSEPDVPGEVESPEVETGTRLDVDCPLPHSAKCGSSVQRPAALRMWGIQNLRGVVHAARHAGRGSWRGSRRTASTRRAAVGSRLTPNIPRRAVTHHAPGRLPYVVTARRTRSPPTALYGC
jgi:hypothetical protein